MKIGNKKKGNPNEAFDQEEQKCSKAEPGQPRVSGAQGVQFNFPIHSITASWIRMSSVCSPVTVQADPMMIGQNHVPPASNPGINMLPVKKFDRLKCSL